MKFPRSSQEAFGVRFQVSDFEEEPISRYTVAVIVLVTSLGAILWLA